MNRTDMLVAPLLDSKNSLADWFAIATLINAQCWCKYPVPSRAVQVPVRPTVMSLHSLHHYCTRHTPAPPPAVYFTQDPIIKL